MGDGHTEAHESTATNQEGRSWSSNVSILKAEGSGLLSDEIHGRAYPRDFGEQEVSHPGGNWPLALKPKPYGHRADFYVQFGP